MICFMIYFWSISFLLTASRTCIRVRNAYCFLLVQLLLAVTGIRLWLIRTKKNNWWCSHSKPALYCSWLDVEVTGFAMTRCSRCHIQNTEKSGYYANNVDQENSHVQTMFFELGSRVLGTAFCELHQRLRPKWKPGFAANLVKFLSDQKKSSILFAPHLEMTSGNRQALLP